MHRDLPLAVGIWAAIAIAWLEIGRLMLQPRKEVVPDSRQHASAHKSQTWPVSRGVKLRVIEGGKA